MTRLPHSNSDGVLQALPAAILDWRLVKRHGKAEVEILVRWQGAEEEDATWENYNNLHEEFSEINLEEEVVLRES